MNKRTSLMLAGLSLFALLPQTHAQDIQLNGGSADITFYYESAQDRWDVVLREKGSTSATGLTNPYTGFDGIVGLGDDWQFDTLTVNVFNPQVQQVGATSYLIASANNSPLNDDGLSPDLGIRTRLRENFGTDSEPLPNVEQFYGFNLTLNASSTFNGSPLAGSGAHVSLLNWNLEDEPVAMLDTAVNNMTAEFANWGHIHRNWGFSEVGEYVLNFDFEGIGGEYGSTASGGSTSITFNVIPEPSTLMLLLGGALGLVSARKLRNRKNA